MSDLRSLQLDFRSAVMHGETAMRGRIVSTEKADAPTRIGIYSDAYRLRLLEVLENDYPGLHTLVGDEAMDKLGRAYIDAYPSCHPSVRRFGRHMSAFLRATRPYSRQPVLTEMADFEWAQNAVFDAQDAPAVGIDDVTAIPPAKWGEMRPIAHPAMRRLNLRWNVSVLWSAIENEQTPPAPEQGEYPRGWLFWRADLHIHWRSMEVDEASAVDACREGASFGEICELLCEWHGPDHAPTQAAGLLKRWIHDGLITAIEFEQESNHKVRKGEE